jgi:Secretion system C-terminal sorting domain
MISSLSNLISFSQFHYCLFIITITLFGANNLTYPQTRGGQGELRDVQTFDKGKIISKPEMVESYDYTVELFPDQHFTGYYYFWSLGGHLEANWKLADSVSWLEVPPSVSSSDTCTEIIAVLFFFRAPDSLGDYKVTMSDSNGNWSNVNITCRVTESPEAFGPYYVDSLLAGASSDTMEYYYSYKGFQIACLDDYAPVDEATLAFQTYPDVPWLKVEPPDYELSLNDSIKVKFIYTNDTTGIFFTYLVKTEGSYSHPTYYLYYRSNGITPVSVLNNKNLPKRFSLLQNYPNPFNPSTTINYQIPTSGMVSIKVYDVLGKEVATLVNEEKPAGSYEANFNAANLSSGIYFYKIQSGSFIETKKMILLK